MLQSRGERCECPQVRLVLLIRQAFASFEYRALQFFLGSQRSSSGPDTPAKGILRPAGSEAGQEQLFSTKLVQFGTNPRIATPWPD